MRRVALFVVMLAMLLMPAAPATAASAVVTFDADGTTLPISAAAADWSKNTDLSVLQGECVGTLCVHFQVVVTPCGIQDVFSRIGGCAYPLADGSCQVEVRATVAASTGWVDDLVTKHEAGHCIWWFGGISVSFHHPDERALMSAVQPGTPTRNEARLTSIDRAFTRDLF